MSESKSVLMDRLRREGRWEEANRYKDDVIAEGRSRGLRRHEASEAAWEATEKAYPPLAAVESTDLSIEMDVSDFLRVQGLSDIPASWDELPGNASLQAEIGWCQANRLCVIEEKANGVVVVHLDRARTPAPSWAALSWLETSIRAYAKYIDVVAKALKDEENEQEMVKREKLAIDEIRSLLAEMVEDNDV